MTIIKNLLDDDFPIGREFYIANSLYPRILVKLPSGKQLVICPEHEETESFIKFISSYDYRFFNRNGGVGSYGFQATFYGVRLEVE